MSFFLVVLDHDKKQFTIEGPMADDTSLNARVVAAQKAGRDVNCSSSGQGATRATVMANAASQFKYQYVPSGSIV